MMRRNGPAIKNAVMRFESNNRKVKLAIQYSNCHKNTLKSTAIRLQLSNMNSHFKAYEDVYRTDGKVMKDNSLVQLLYPTAQQKKELHSITLDGVTYGKETIIVIDEEDGGFFFGKILNVFVIDEQVIFRYNPFSEYGFHPHFFAYLVNLESDVTCFIDYKSLSVKVPCLLFVIRQHQLITSRFKI
ncbi:hypothetical protein QAD02_018391 [Eretmocerus hayati]|uniref:Uncharacterized protein n=1 Tax=Eretmocerus hayati TaxID=131215 RepID=A0ACC2PG84_9HYME|nr:hypothetical protein QAD02_018391 [Eretmocerus hayati]